MWSGGIIGQWRVILLGVQETRESIMMNIRPKLTIAQEFTSTRRQ
jgi:hypothetical protein